MWKWAFVGVFLCASYAADVIVDQEFVPPDHLVRLDTQIGIAPFLRAAQTFTPQMGGQLAGFDFWIAPLGGEPLRANLKVEVQNTTAAGAPSGDSLATVVLPPSFLTEQPSHYKHIDLRGANLDLRAGQLYAAVFTAEPYVPAGNAAYNLRGHEKNQLGGDFNYPPGQGMFTENGTLWRDYAGPDFDFVFRTYMVIPEPRPVLIFTFFAISLGNSRSSNFPITIFENSRPPKHRIRTRQPPRLVSCVVLTSLVSPLVQLES